MQRELAALSREAANLRRELAVTKEQSLRSAQALLDVEARLALALAQVVDLEERDTARTEELLALRDRVQRAERVTIGMTSSLSWRLTAPLRSLKRRA